MLVAGGVAGGERLLPPGWVDYARTMVSIDPDPENPSPYGAHWWGMKGDTLQDPDPLADHWMSPSHEPAGPVESPVPG